MFYDVIYLSTPTSSCRETDVKAMLFVHDILSCQLRVKCEKENRPRQSRTAGWQRNVLGLFCMDIIAKKGRHEFAYHLH